MQNNFESVKCDIKALYDHIKENENELFSPNRVNDRASFFTLFKDALFHYTNGVFLCERFYRNNFVQFENIAVPKFTEEDRALHKEMSEFVENISKENIPLTEDTKKQADDYVRLLTTSNHPFENVEVPVYTMAYGERQKILLQSLKDTPDEFSEIMSSLISEQLNAIVRSMFLFLENDYSFEVKLMPYDEYIDMIAILKTK